MIDTATSDPFDLLDLPAKKPPTSVKKSRVRRTLVHDVNDFNDFNDVNIAHADKVEEPWEPVDVKTDKQVKLKKAPAAREPKIAKADPSVKPGVNPDVSRNHFEWLVREDDAIMKSVMAESSTVTLFDLAAKFKRDALLVAKHILAGDIPHLVGLQADFGSEEEAEFLGLTLGGAPIALALKWCSATEEQEGRPTVDQVEKSLIRGDQRNAMNLIRESGIWFSSIDQLEYISSLEAMDPEDVSCAVAELLDHIEAPTPKMVFEQLCGFFEGAPSVNWDVIGTGVSSLPKGSWKTSPKKSRTKLSTRVIKAGDGRKSTSYKKKSSSKRRGSYSGYASKTTKSKRYAKKRSCAS